MNWSAINSRSEHLSDGTGRIAGSREGHTREGAVIAAARRPNPMVEVDGATPLAGSSLPALQHLMEHFPDPYHHANVQIAPQDVWREYAERCKTDPACPYLKITAVRLYIRPAHPLISSLAMAIVMCRARP